MPRYQGKRGHPAGFGPTYRGDLLGLSGDTGAKALIDAAGDIRWIDVEDAGILADVDAPVDLARLTKNITAE